MRLKIKILLTVMLAGLSAGLAPAASSLASTGVIYLSPNHSSVEKGHEFTVGIRISPGTAVDSVQTTLYYSTGTLQFMSSSPSAFPTCTVNSGGSGSVQLACTILGGSTSSDSLISNVTFKALTGSGSSSLTLASPGTGSSNSNAARSGSWTNPSVSSGSVSFSSPPTSSGSSGSSSGSSIGSSTSYSGTSSSTSSSSVAKPKPAPKVTLTKPSANPGLDSATISVSTNISASAYAKFGTSSNDLSQSSAKSSGTSHSLSLTNLTPGTTYYYQVFATGTQGQKTNSSVGSFTTNGFTVQVTVLDSHNQPLVNQTVTLHSTPITTTTNSNGVATFYNVAPGVHHLEYTNNGQTYSQTVYVANEAPANGSQSVPTQTAAVIYKKLTLAPVALKKSNNKIIWYVLAGILVLFVLWAILLRKVLRAKLANFMSAVKNKKNFSMPSFAGNLHPPKNK